MMSTQYSIVSSKLQIQTETILTIYELHMEECRLSAAVYITLMASMNVVPSLVVSNKTVQTNVQFPGKLKLQKYDQSCSLVLLAEKVCHLTTTPNRLLMSQIFTAPEGSDLAQAAPARLSGTHIHPHLPLTYCCHFLHRTQHLLPKTSSSPLQSVSHGLLKSSKSLKQHQLPKGPGGSNGSLLYPLITSIAIFPGAIPFPLTPLTSQSVLQKQP